LIIAEKNPATAVQMVSLSGEIRSIWLQGWTAIYWQSCLHSIVELPHSSQRRD
jgi:hypothetical protein